MARLKKIKLADQHRSTTPGYVNENGQQVVGDTGAASTGRKGQRVYRLRCTACEFEYGVAGIDIDKRLCPSHQAGVAGEPLRERGPGLFD